MLAERLNTCDSCIECPEKIPLFDILDKKELKTINFNRYSVYFKPGELILKQGLPSTHVISLVHGLAKMYFEGFHSKNILFKLLDQGQLIDEASVFAHEVNHFSVSALTDVKVCFIEAENFKKVMHHNNEFACAIIQQRSTHSTYFYKRLVSLTQKQMSARMADGLLYLSKEFYKSSKFDLNLSRQDIADLTAMSKDSAIRILKEFDRDRIISLKAKKMEILELAALQKISSEG